MGVLSELFVFYWKYPPSFLNLFLFPSSYFFALFYFHFIVIVFYVQLCTFVYCILLFLCILHRYTRITEIFTPLNILTSYINTYIHTHTYKLDYGHVLVLCQFCLCKTSVTDHERECYHCAVKLQNHAASKH